MATNRQERTTGDNRTTEDRIIDERMGVDVDEPAPPVANTLVGAPVGVTPATPPADDLTTRTRAGTDTTWDTAPDLPPVEAGPNWGAIIATILIIGLAVFLLIWLF